jgi:hypothetical protein
VNLKGVGNIIGAFIGLAIVAVVAARPQFLDVTFKGVGGVISAANAPVTGKR